MMTYACNVSLWETEAGELPVLANWGYTSRPSLTTKQIPSEVQTRGGALKMDGQQSPGEAETKLNLEEFAKIQEVRTEIWNSES